MSADKLKITFILQISSKVTAAPICPLKLGAAFQENELSQA
jgi:hypothetical protein